MSHAMMAITRNYENWSGPAWSLLTYHFAAFQPLQKSNNINYQ